LHRKIEISDELRISDSVQVVAETQTEPQELLIMEFNRKVKQIESAIDKMQKDNVESRKKTERNSWIRTFVGVVSGFLLGRVTPFIGF